MLKVTYFQLPPLYFQFLLASVNSWDLFLVVDKKATFLSCENFGFQTDVPL